MIKLFDSNLNRDLFTTSNYRLRQLSRWSLNIFHTRISPDRPNESFRLR